MFLGKLTLTRETQAHKQCLSRLCSFKDAFTREIKKNILLNFDFHFKAEKPGRLLSRL